VTEKSEPALVAVAAPDWESTWRTSGRGRQKGIPSPDQKKKKKKKKKYSRGNREIHREKRGDPSRLKKWQDEQTNFGEPDVVEKLRQASKREKGQ